MPEFEAVTLAGVSRHFGRHRALADVTLELKTGEILGLIGPNGAGKSTLLGILATLVAASSGEVRYGGRRAKDLGGGLRQRIGFLAHELYLYSELSARQNLTLFARLYDVPTPTTTVDAALAAAGLTQRADDDVSAFSRGMRQRLALERALLHGPRLVLLDEPFTGLDDQAATVVLRRIRALAAQGAIVVLATHDLDLADGLLTRVAVLRFGRLVSDEPAGAGLRTRYRTLVGSL